ncbi:DUF2057 family protein [Vibrio sp. 10N.261.52.C11]|uniref:DUF2057 family protein n=1 Tax=unclassified Vibrio TaxID=2614977 RepID=UPI00354E61A3
MKKLFYFLILSGSISANSAELSVSHTLKLHAVNNEKPVDSDVIELSTGENQLVVSYSEILKDGSQSRFYSSSPFVIEFEVKKDEMVSLNSPNIRRYRDAQKAFSKTPPEFTVSQDEDDLDAKIYSLVSQNEITPFTDIVDLVQENNRNSGKIFTNSGIVNADIAATSIKNLSLSSDSVRQLQAWYIKASKKERKEFRKWMIDQE